MGAECEMTAWDGGVVSIGSISSLARLTFAEVLPAIVGVTAEFLGDTPRLR